MTQGYSWDLDPKDNMVMVVTNNGETILRIFLGEAMESAGKTAVMKHVAECNRSPWIKTWHDEMWVALKDPRGVNVKTS